MGDPVGFIRTVRKEGGNRPLNERLNDFSEVEQTLNEEDRKLQASRCMDCGIPFCQWGCPVINNMPEWQDAVFKGDWQKAVALLQSTNNFPEFTGRVCPAPCETACVLALYKEPVTIRENEAAVAEKAFERGLILPMPPQKRTGKKVAVVGSGPAGLACADLLNKKGHMVTVFEKDERPGGLLRYGIPDFKLAKNIVERRINLLLEEGIIFNTGADPGNDIPADNLTGCFDAICLAVGATKPRDLPVRGRDLKGIHFAMEYLSMQNRIVSGTIFNNDELITARDKHVLVIGGGDTGSDCVGTANRQGARSVTQIEIMPEPPAERDFENPWPYPANIKKSSTSHEEGCIRMWNKSTLQFSGIKDRVRKAEIADVEWYAGNNGKMQVREIPGTVRQIDAELVLIAIGFTHPVHEGLLDSLGLEYTPSGNIVVTQANHTSKTGIFAAGDCVTGASLVVTAIASGRKAAAAIIDYLENSK